MFCKEFLETKLKPRVRIIHSHNPRMLKLLCLRYRSSFFQITICVQCPLWSGKLNFFFIPLTESQTGFSWMSPKTTNAFHLKVTESRWRPSYSEFSWYYIMLELDSRFGVERVQSVSLLSGQGHRLAASEETDPLTVDHCCGGPGCRTIYPVYIQPGRWVSAGGRRRHTLQEDAAPIYGALSVAGVKLFQQSFGFSFMRGMSCFHHFQTHFSQGDLGVICF